MLALKTDQDIRAAWSEVYRQMPELHPIIRPIYLRLHGVIDRKREPRLIRGAFLVINGHVTPNGTPSSFDVRSQSKPRRVYQVTAKRDQWECIIIQDPGASKVGERCPDVAKGLAPDFGYGPRCKHMIAAMLFNQLDKKRDTPPADQRAEVSPSRSLPHFQEEGAQNPPHSTTPSPETQRRIVDFYPNGKPARLDDGTVIGYTAVGTPVELPAWVGDLPSFHPDTRQKIRHLLELEARDLGYPTYDEWKEI